MGTTRDALNAGSTSYVLVAAIEGYSELFTNGDTSAVATAWASTGWSTVKGGLFAEIQISQSMNPTEPICEMGSCVLRMMPQGHGAADVFGVAVGRKTAPYETLLAGDVDHDDTSIQVKSTAGWPASGYLHIGTECIHYSAIADATHFTADQRGCFSPFGSYSSYIGGSTERSFTHIHNVGEDANQVNLQPVVSSTPRTWIGRWVGVWAHRVVSGVLDTRAEAELLFAGQIVDIRDDPNDGSVAVQLKALTDLNEVTVGQSQWEGAADEGVYLAAGDVFRFDDTGAGADNLVVVASGATGAYQMNEGIYSLGDLCAVLSAWLAQANTDGDIDGTYSVASPVTIPPNGELRTKVYWILPGASVGWTLSMPPRVSEFLGFKEIEVADVTLSANRAVGYPAAFALGPGSAALQHWHPGATPGAWLIETNGTGGGARATFTTTTGEIADQATTLGSLNWMLSGAITSIGGTWALFSIGERIVVAKYTDNADGTYSLEYISSIFLGTSDKAPDYTPITVPPGGEAPRFRQVYLLQGDPITMVISLLCSMGTAGYNTPYAALPPDCSASIPYELVRSLPNTMAGLAGITGPTAAIAIVLEKPTRLSELISSDFAARMVFLCWRAGELSMGEWRTPTTALAVESLTDANKADPAGHITNQKSATSENSDWLRPIVKFRYNRNPLTPSGDDYLDQRTFIDRTSVEDMGGSGKTVTINLRNTYAGLSGPASSLDSLMARYLSVAPLVSRPARRVNRPIDPRYFLRLGLGDVVLLTDTFARDPETGLRGLSSRPALVTKISYTFGGADVGGGTTPIIGQVDLLFSDQNPEKQGAPYVPAAMVNDLYSVGSYDHGYLSSGPTLRLYANRFTETTDTGGRDSSYFNPGDSVIIIERDPEDPDDPVKWSRTIAASGVANDAITLTSALSSPDFDNTKQYYVISQTYSAATATQHRNTYQADASDALIEDTTRPYTYGAGGGSTTYTTNAGMDSLYPFSNMNTVEMPPTLVRIDGAGRDVAWEAAVARLLNNLSDYKLQPQLPMVSNVEMSNTTVTGTGYQLVAYSPIWLNFENPSASVYRLMTLALTARSTDGTSTKCRVTLSRERPSFPTTDNVAWSGTYGQAEWTGITSTTAALLADRYITTNIKAPLGEAWLSIELGYKCATRGLTKCVVGVRQS